MSSSSDEIYDEDGNLKDDEYNLDTFSHYEEAKRFVKERRVVRIVL